MKYAFVIGTSAFIVPSRVVSYADQEGDHEFLRINSIYDGKSSALNIDLHIKDLHGTEISLVSNKQVTEPPYLVTVENNSVKIIKDDGNTLIHIHQLDDEAAMGLEHNIVAELEVNSPAVAIRITGEFFVDGLHIRAENEKLHINDIGYATAAMAGQNQLVFTSEGVVL